ncbi:VOC family protein [Microbacterium sp. C23T]
MIGDEGWLGELQPATFAASEPPGGWKEAVMVDPVADVIGDYAGFVARQGARLRERGIDISAYELGHLAVRVPEWELYVHQRTLLERHAVASFENVWNGRPISLILLAEPLRAGGGKEIPLIELIPPVHQRVYKMGMEHFGVVIGDDVDAFSRQHRAVLTGQQFQNEWNEPYYILFEDFTHVKFHRRSLRAVVELQGGTFDGINHVEGWIPQRLVTATGPDPLPR